ncbi:MAG TPA: dipeptidase [Alphaproteobacteria bacterium]|nr:dipeptidase [Alphaproteobacteria bacterium]
MTDWQISARGRALHSAGIVWDAHTCLPLTPGQSMEPLERHRAAGVTFVSVNVGMDFNPVSQIMRVIANFRAWLERHSDRFLLADSVDDIDRAKRQGKLAVAFDLEGAAMLENDLAMVQLFSDLGVRQIHLAYNRDNSVAGGCHGNDAPLTAFGRQVVQEINRVGLLMDCSHSGYRTSMEVMERSTRPVIFSHSNVRELKDHARNIRNDQIVACAQTGGVIAVSGIGIFLGANDIRLETLVRHIDYIAERVGAAHIGLGLDYVFGALSGDLPAGSHPDEWWPPGNEYDLDDMAIVPPERFPEITEALLARGYSDIEVRGILGENMTRVARETWNSKRK